MGGKSIPFWLLRFKEKKKKHGQMDLVQPPLQKVSISFLISSPISFGRKSPLSSSACRQACLASPFESGDKHNSDSRDNKEAMSVRLSSSYPPSRNSFDASFVGKHCRSASSGTLLVKNMNDPSNKNKKPLGEGRDLWPEAGLAVEEFSCGPLTPCSSSILSSGVPRPQTLFETSG